MKMATAVCRYKQDMDARKLEQMRASNEELAAQVRRLTAAADDTAEDMKRMAATCRKLRSENEAWKEHFAKNKWQITAEANIKRHLENISDEARRIMEETVGMQKEEQREKIERAATRLETLAEWMRDK